MPNTPVSKSPVTVRLDSQCQQIVRDAVRAGVAPDRSGAIRALLCAAAAMNPFNDEKGETTMSGKFCYARVRAVMRDRGCDWSAACAELSRRAQSVREARAESPAKRRLAREAMARHEARYEPQSARERDEEG